MVAFLALIPVRSSAPSVGGVAVAIRASRGQKDYEDQMGQPHAEEGQRASDDEAVPDQKADRKPPHDSGKIENI